MKKRWLFVLLFIPLLLNFRKCSAATTYTTNAGIPKPGDGDTGWGPTLRAAFDIIDSSFTLISSSGTFSELVLNPTAALSRIITITDAVYGEKNFLAINNGVGGARLYFATNMDPTTGIYNNPNRGSAQIEVVSAELGGAFSIKTSTTNNGEQSLIANFDNTSGASFFYPLTAPMATISTAVLSGYFQLASKTLAQLAASTPTAVGQEYYCSNCVTDAVCISTQSVTAKWARTSLRTTACQ